MPEIRNEVMVCNCYQFVLGHGSEWLLRFSCSRQGLLSATVLSGLTRDGHYCFASNLMGQSSWVPCGPSGRGSYSRCGRFCLTSLLSDLCYCALCPQNLITCNTSVGRMDFLWSHIYCHRLLWLALCGR